MTAPGTRDYREYQNAYVGDFSQGFGDSMAMQQCASWSVPIAGPLPRLSTLVSATFGVRMGTGGIHIHMADVKIFTTEYCPYCVRAKRLLTQKGVAYEEVDVSDDALREKMVIDSGGRRTVPDLHRRKPIGGYDELAALGWRELDRCSSQASPLRPPQGEGP
jgi:glutaredoxin 3